MVTVLFFASLVGPSGLANSMDGTGSEEISSSALVESVQEETQVGPIVLGYKSWKDRQIVEAQNRVVRLSNKIVLERKRIGSASGNNKVSDELKQSELELDVLRENLQFARDLTLEDYVANYLTNFEESDKKLAGLLEKLTKEEMLEIVRSYLKLRRSKEVGFQPRLTGVPPVENKNPSL